jgi:hypothetical protein
VPDNVSNEVIVDVVTSYMRENPAAAGLIAKRNYNASVVVGTALGAKFPSN